MSNCHSAFSTATSPGGSGAGPSDAPVMLDEVRIGALHQLAGWDDFETGVQDALLRMGAKLPTAFGRVETAPGLRIYRTAPGRVLVLSDRAQPIPQTDPFRIVALDLSHSRIALALRGPNAADVLSRCAPMDFSARYFPPGQFVQTVIHEVSVLIDRRSDDSFTLLVPYTWSASVLGRLCRAAAPFGYGPTIGLRSRSI